MIPRKDERRLVDLVGHADDRGQRCGERLGRVVEVAANGCHAVGQGEPCRKGELRQSELRGERCGKHRGQSVQSGHPGEHQVDGRLRTEPPDRSGQAHRGTEDVGSGDRVIHHMHRPSASKARSD